VRADAEGIFIPVADLPGAGIGDAVVIEAADRSEPRTATIVAVDERDGQSFLRLSFGS